MFAAAMHSARHPILAQIVPIRRCNLACAYCSEFDRYSPPVPKDEMLRRVDLLAALGTTIITLSGGEPMLAPDLDEIIRHIRRRGAIASLITNGYLLTPDRIRRLNRAGLDYLQISIDNVEPDEISKKSLKVLNRKLEWLARHAEFSVTVNAVLGGSMRNPEDAFRVAHRARELGFTCTVGVLHDHAGQLLPLSPEQSAVHERILKLSNSLFSFAHYDRFQRNIARGLPNIWHCPAGGRFLYICEDGLVHYCSQQRGRPGVPLESYTRQRLEIESGREKPCAPYCTVSCAHQTAMLDSFREDPRGELARMMARRSDQDPDFRPPPLLRLLSWVFLDSGNRRLFNNLALRVLGVRSARCGPAQTAE